MRHAFKSLKLDTSSDKLTFNQYESWITKTESAQEVTNAVKKVSCVNSPNSDDKSSYRYLGIRPSSSAEEANIMSEFLEKKRDKKYQGEEWYLLWSNWWESWKEFSGFEGVSTTVQYSLIFC